MLYCVYGQTHEVMLAFARQSLTQWSCIDLHPILKKCTAPIPSQPFLFPEWRTLSLLLPTHSWWLPLALWSVSPHGSVSNLVSHVYNTQKLSSFASRKTDLQFHSQSPPVCSCSKHLTHLGLGVIPSPSCHWDNYVHCLPPHQRYQWGAKEVVSPKTTANSIEAALLSTSFTMPLSRKNLKMIDLEKYTTKSSRRTQASGLNLVSMSFDLAVFQDCGCRNTLWRHSCLLLNSLRNQISHRSFPSPSATSQ